VARQAWADPAHPDLLRLDVGIFVLHAILMASFVALPLAWSSAGLPKAALVGLPDRAADLIFRNDPVHHLRREEAQDETRVAGAVSVLLLSYSSGSSADSLRGLVIGTVVFFTAFNLLEASLPSLVSKVSPAGGKGTAMGCIPPASSSVRHWAGSSVAGCSSTAV
jgi:hypothetical protein